MKKRILVIIIASLIPLYGCNSENNEKPVFNLENKTSKGKNHTIDSGAKNIEKSKEYDLINNEKIDNEKEIIIDSDKAENKIRDKDIIDKEDDYDLNEKEYYENKIIIKIPDYEESYSFSIDKKIIEEPNMYLVNKDLEIKDFLVNNEFNLSYFDDSRDQIIKYLNEYNEMVLKVHEDFIKNRKKTYSEFKQYYQDFNEEIINIEKRENEVCLKESESFDKENCENLRIHKDTVMTSYNQTKDVLFELIEKMNRDEIDIIKEYNRQKKEQIKRARN